MEEIYVVKVRTDPDPARLYPSERRYSALTVGGLGAVHLLLAATSILLGCMGLALQSDSCWTGRYGGGLWLGIAAAAAGATGILAWRRWYVDNNIRWFFISSTIAAATSLLCLIITAAALAAIQEERSNQELYRSIFYDKGVINQHSIHNQPTKINESEGFPVLSLHGNHQSDNHIQETQEHSTEVTTFDSVAQSSTTNSEGSESSIISSSHGLFSDNSEGISQAGSVKYNENVKMLPNKSSPKETVSSINAEINSETVTVQSNESIGNDSSVSGQGRGSLSKQNHEMTHIMRIANTKTNRHTDNVNISTEATLDAEPDPAVEFKSEDQYNRSKKSTYDYKKDILKGHDENLRISVTEDDQIYLTNQDIPEVNGEANTSSVRYEIQDVQNVPERINIDDDINHTISLVPSPKQRLKQDEPQYERIPKAGREVRTVVAINVLVASALELAWSILSASIAWKGMKNCYQHENNSNNCDRTVEGLERAPSPVPPSSNDTNPSNKRHNKMDGIFRKPDIISNHRHCNSGNSAHSRTVQEKNGINRLNMINTVSERINIEPYLPMEESTMEYQERVHRFLASNNVATNNSDNVSNIDS